MSINTAPINSGAINAAPRAGELVVLSGTIEQTVVFLEVFALSGVVQQTVFEVHTVVSGIQQRVFIPVAPTATIVWEIIATLDGGTVIDLTGEMEVSAGEAESRLATFQARPVSGAFTWSDFIAKSVTLDYADSAGVFRRLFTGIVDEVAYDATENIVTFDCTSNRKDAINALTRDELTARIGGRWSKFIFDEDADPFQFASDQLLTIPSSYDSDAYGVFRTTPFAAKVTPDLTLTESDILDASVVPTFVSRDRLLNEITLSFDYRFTRLRHRERSYTWDLLDRTVGDGYDTWGAFMRNPSVFMPRDALLTAVESTSWVLKDDVIFTDLPEAGFFDGIGWSPRRQFIKVNDEGKVVRRVQKDESGLYATAATFTLAKRFAQTMTEGYEVTISAPQSVSQYGAIKSAVTRGMVAEYDSFEWEEFTQYKIPTGSTSPNGDNVTDKTDSTVEGDRDEFDNAIETALAIGYREIKEAHRQNYVDFQVLLDPTIELHQTVYVNTTRVQARGKVVNVEHTAQIDAEDGQPSALTQVRIAISKAQGSTSETAIAAPTVPSETDPAFTPRTVILSTHIGNHFASPPYDNQWSGWLTNFSFQDFVSASLPRYPVAFVVDGEKVVDADRKEREIPALSSVNVEIPDELLTVTAP